MKSLLMTLMILIIGTQLSGQIKTPEVEVRAPTTTWLNEIHGTTKISDVLDVSEIPGVFFLVNPQISMSSESPTQNYERGLRVLMTNAYGIPGGITDTGYRIGIDVSAHAIEANFEGTLESMQGMRIQFGTNSNYPTGTIKEVRGLNLQGLTSANAQILDAYAIYQSGGSFKNYFEGNVGIGTTNPDMELHVEGDALIRSGSGAELNLLNTGTNKQWQVVSGMNSGFEIGNVTDGRIDANAPFFITASGNVGLSNTNPQSKLTVNAPNFDLSGKQGVLIGGGSEGLGNYTPAIGFSNSMGAMDAAISGVQEGSDRNAMGLAFFVHPSGTAADPKIEALRISRQGKVGIGTTNPDEELHVEGDALIRSGAGAELNLLNTGTNKQWQVVSGVSGGFEISNVTDGLVDYDAPFYITSGGNVGLGTTSPGVKFGVNSGTINTAGRFESSDTRVTVALRDDATTYGVGISGVGDKFQILAGPGTGVVATFDENGNVSIGNNNQMPSEKLHVYGNIVAANYNNNSDRRWKRDIKEISRAKSTLENIHAVSYRWKRQEFPDRDFDDKLHYGVIAQELEKVLPELVSVDNEGYKSVDYIGMIGLLIKGFQERGEEIERLKAELTAKSDANGEALNALVNRLEKLEALLIKEGNASQESSISEKE